MTITRSDCRETFVASYLACAALCSDDRLADAARRSLMAEASTFFDAHAEDCEAFGAALAGECLWFTHMGNESLRELAFAGWPGEAAARLALAAESADARFLIPSEDGDFYVL